MQSPLPTLTGSPCHLRDQPFLRPVGADKIVCILGQPIWVRISLLSDSARMAQLDETAQLFLPKYLCLPVSGADIADGALLRQTPILRIDELENTGINREAALQNRDPP